MKTTPCSVLGTIRAGGTIPAALMILMWLSGLLHTVGWAARLQNDGYHVFPGESIQDAMQAAARNPTNKIVKVHAGEYRPTSQRQALIWFNKQHDGIHLEALGEVTLTAANPEISTPASPGYPAAVNHVVYFGNGISSNTMIRGFRLTGANRFVTEKLTRQIEPDTSVPKNLFFLTDGGAIKVFGRSYPVIRDVVISDNNASPCGAGISVQHEGFNQDSTLIENCVFKNNKAQVTGAAVDLLRGSAARIVNCLFVGNVSNTGIDVVAQRSGEAPFTNSGVLTIFQESRAWVQRCTFTGNRNGVDDLGGRSVYTNCIFFNNRIEGGLPGGARYELDLPAGATVSGCFIGGALIGLRNAVSPKDNVLSAPDPKFNEFFIPEALSYSNAGYRRSPARPGPK